jgi:hypothetical protein
LIPPQTSPQRTDWNLQSNRCAIGAEKSLRAAEELTRKQLGNDARTSIAMTDSGIYRGFVIGETADYVVQQISKSSAIAHPKEPLDGDARAGQKLSITYSNSHAPWRGDS